MKRFMTAVLLALVCVLSFEIGQITSDRISAQAPLPAKPDVAPVLTLEQHDHFISLKFTSLQVYTAQVALQREFDDKMKNDPRWGAYMAQQRAVSSDIEEYEKTVSKGVDEKKWHLNLDSLRYDAVPASKP